MARTNKYQRDSFRRCVNTTIRTYITISSLLWPIVIMAHAGFNINFTDEVGPSQLEPMRGGDDCIYPRMQQDSCTSRRLRPNPKTTTILVVG